MLNKIENKEEQNVNSIHSEIITTRADEFNRKKNELKIFGGNLPDEAKLPSVPTTGGMFDLFDYKVTGTDLNKLTKGIQDKMIEQNRILVRNIQEFNTIYDTFSALDKEYIQGILVSLKAAREANAKALKGVAGVQTNQNEINHIINQQKQVIEVLKKFKQKIEKIEHLEDIDKIFADFYIIQSSVEAIETSVSSKVKIQEETISNINTEMKSLHLLYSRLDGKIDNQNELQDKQFDDVNQIISKHADSISSAEAVIEDNKAKILELTDKVTINGEKVTSLAKAVDDTKKTISEVVAKVLSDVDKKIDSTNIKIAKNMTRVEGRLNNLHLEIEKHSGSLTERVDSKLSAAKKEITVLSQQVKNLSKSLKTTRIISLINIIIVCVLMILIVSEVL
ncbi:hypothetical protein [Sporolactobacillus terrae]|uniref:hypothetical protein n=1 Tax=Sporolactobacillus terrae TaxID=269673 RepID=UPI0006861D09|nr:hypothetical protein [Sporolactobacillus terrae]UAK16752.1 hypothetical protein K7399_01940 [Sporolactobacillus terrae]